EDGRAQREAYEKIAKKQKERSDLIDATRAAFLYTFIDRQPRGERMLSKYRMVPNPAYKATSRATSIFSKVRGYLWIDDDAEQLARAELEVTEDISIGGFLATHNVGVVQALVPGAHLDVVVVERGNRFGRFHAIAHALVIFHRNQRTLLRFDPRVLTGDDAEAIYNEHVCAEVGYAVGNVKVHPGDHAHHRHKGGYGQNYAQQGEKAAQL